MLYIDLASSLTPLFCLRGPLEGTLPRGLLSTTLTSDTWLVAAGALVVVAGAAVVVVVVVIVVVVLVVVIVVFVCVIVTSELLSVCEPCSK